MSNVLRNARRRAAGRSRPTNATRLDYIKSKCIIDANGCWLWQGGLVHGYGKTSINNKTQRVHRVVYELVMGQISDDTNVLHKCDVRHCCNPEHLWLGTHYDNRKDYCLKHNTTGAKFL
jgi:hypothetical protein